MNKLLGLFFVFFFLSMNLCFAVDKQEFFVIKNSKIIKLEIDGQHQLAFQGDIKIIYDSDSTYLEYLNQKIKDRVPPKFYKR